MGSLERSRSRAPLLGIIEELQLDRDVSRSLEPVIAPTIDLCRYMQPMRLKTDPSNLVVRGGIFLRGGGAPVTANVTYRLLRNTDQCLVIRSAFIRWSSTGAATAEVLMNAIASDSSTVAAELERVATVASGSSRLTDVPLWLPPSIGFDVALRYTGNGVDTVTPEISIIAEPYPAGVRPC